MSGGWIGDPRSEPCEMGGGPLVQYPHPCSMSTYVNGNERGGKTREQAVKLALQLAADKRVVFACATEEIGNAMHIRVESLLLEAGLWPVSAYMKRFSVNVNSEEGAK